MARRREDLSGWNPMEDDYMDDDFNSYNEGPGKNLPKRSQRTSSCVKLYVTGIPEGTTNEGLRDLFGRAGMVLNASVCVNKFPGNRRTTFGFVEMENTAGGTEALRLLNGFRIGDEFVLRVQIAKSDEEKQREKEEKQRELEFLDSLPGVGKKRSSIRNTSDSGSDTGDNFVVSRTGEKIMFGKQRNLANGSELHNFQMSPRSMTSDKSGLCTGSKMSAANVDPSIFHTPVSNKSPAKLSERFENLQITTPNEGARKIAVMKEELQDDFTGLAAQNGYGDNYNRFNRNSYFRGRGMGPFGDMHPMNRNMGGYGRGRGAFNIHSQQHFPPGGYGGPMGRGFHRQGGYSGGYNGGYGGGGYNGGYGGGGYNGGYIADFNSGYGRGYNGSYRDDFRRGYHGQGNQYSNYQNGNQFQDNRPRPKSINYRPEYPRKKNYGRRPCNVCQNEGPFNCSICGTPYCSQSCQKDDWPRHKAFCQKLKVEREEEEAIESQFEFSVGDDILEKMVKTVEQFTGDKVEVKKKNTSQQKSPKQGSPKKKKSLSPKSKQGNNKSPGSKPNHNVQNDPSKSGTSSQKSPRVAYQNTSGTTCKQVASGSTPASSKLTIKMDALPINVETDVIVLSVSGPDSIMLQLFNEKNVQVAVELEEKMTQMYSKDGNMVEVSPVVGDFLAGQYMGSWYRLCVDEVISNDTFKVTYIDYGNKEEVALPQMRYLSEEMLTLPGQAIECCLEGVVLPGHASSPQVIEKVKELIPPTVTSGSLYKATAIKHQNNLTHIKILDINGVDVGKQLAEKGLASTSTTEKGSNVIAVSSIGNVIDSLNIGTCLQLFVIERLSPTRFICQIVEQDFLKKFSEFQQQFTKLYQHNTFPEYRPKSVGELVVGNFSMDKEWYRAEVLEMTESQANLCYIDFGNKETVPFSCIRYARDICTKLPSQSFVCVVADVDSETLPESSLSMLNDALSQQKLTVKVKKTEGKELHVDLLNSEGQAILEASKPQEKKIIFTDVAKLQIPTDGQKLDMMFSDATSLYSFYMRRSDSESQAVLGNVMREVHEYCSKTDIPYSPVIDEMVCGKFSADGVWYRARVLDIIEDVYAVQYVDYGTLDSVRSDAIRKIDPCLLTTPIQAVHCRLARVMPELETSDMLKMFATAMGVPSMKVQATHIGNDITDILIYTDDGASLNERMLVPDEEISEKEVKADVKSNLETLERLEGKALDKSDLEKLQVPLDGTKVKVMVTDFFGLCSFVVQSLENLQAFAELMNEMGIHCESISSPYSAAVGETICAKFSDDNIWYRAKVLECIAGENYKVVFLDYGNFDILTPASFRRLDPRFVGMPSQSFPCKLLGVEEEGQPEDALATFAGKVSNTALELEAVNVVDGVYEVKLYDSDGCEINSLFSKGSSPMLEASNGGGVVTEISPPKILTKLSEMTKQSPPEGQCSVLITHANSPQDFYCQLAEYEAIQSLAVLMQSLMLSCEMEKQTPNFAPSIGDLCCAIYAADGGWYRGVVTGVNDGNYSILYLDFGNEGIVPADKIRSPTLEFSSLPIMAFKCSLTGITPMGGSWSSASMDKMNGYQARELSATIMSKSDNVHQVQISCDGVDIASQLISCGLAQKTAASNTQGKEVDEKEALQRQIMELQAKLKLIG